MLACGTIRANWKGFPKDIVLTSAMEKRILHMPWRGTIDALCSLSPLFILLKASVNQPQFSVILLVELSNHFPVAVMECQEAQQAVSCNFCGTGPERLCCLCKGSFCSETELKPQIQDKHCVRNMWPQASVCTLQEKLLGKVALTCWVLAISVPSVFCSKIEYCIDFRNVCMAVVQAFHIAFNCCLDFWKLLWNVIFL